MASEINVDKITPQTGTTLELGDSGDTITVTGTLDGSGLTGLNATNLTSGTVPDARFPSALPAIDGSALTGIVSGLEWESKNIGFGAEVSKAYFVDTSSAALSAVLPASPSVGDEIRFLDVAGTFDTNNLTVTRNGNNIQGDASDLVVSVERAGFALVYYNATQGWLIKDK